MDLAYHASCICMHRVGGWGLCVEQRIPLTSPSKGSRVHEVEVEHGARCGQQADGGNQAVRCCLGQVVDQTCTHSRVIIWNDVKVRILFYRGASLKALFG